MPKKLKKSGNANVHEDLHGFDIKINEFGEMTSNLNIDAINDFLNKNIEGKKIDTSKED